MTIKVGDKLPDTTFTVMGPEGPKPVTTAGPVGEPLEHGYSSRGGAGGSPGDVVHCNAAWYGCTVSEQRIGRRQKTRCAPAWRTVQRSFQGSPGAMAAPGSCSDQPSNLPRRSHHTGVQVIARSEPVIASLPRERATNRFRAPTPPACPQPNARAERTARLGRTGVAAPASTRAWMRWIMVR